MDAGIVGNLVNLGAAGAVIILTYYLVNTFLKVIKERDEQWQDYFTKLNDQLCKDAERRLVLTENILNLTENNLNLTGVVLSEIKAHDLKSEQRIAAASKVAADTVKATLAAAKRKPAVKTE